MTTYNTGNPVGSTDPKDLYDNAQNLDALVNSTTELSHADRLAVQRKTWHGMEVEFDAAQSERAGEFAQFLADSAYQDLGVYGAGIEVTRYNQVFLKDGEFYRAAASLGLPYTTTGLWASESGSFVGVGDAVLRQDLDAPGGSDLVGYDSGTAQDVLDESKPMANYTALRNYAGRATGVRITQAGLAGFFQRDDVDTTSADNGGTIIVDGAGRRWKRLVTGDIQLSWFGGKADWDGSVGTYNSAALQAAGNAALSIGAALDIGSGYYLCDAKVTFDLRVSGSPALRRYLNIKGAGSNQSALIFSSTDGLEFIGAAVVGVNNGDHRLSLSGFEIRQPSIVRSGFALFAKSMTKLKTNDVTVTGFGIGFDLEDVLVSHFSNGKISYAGTNVRSRVNTYSRMNLTRFESFGFVAAYDAFADVQGCNLEFDTCGFEGLGLTTTGDRPDYAAIGLKYQGSPDGYAGLSLSNCYFENNKGAADLYIDALWTSNASIKSTNFNRAGSTRYSTANIVLANGSIGAEQHVALEDCGFLAAGTYTPNASRQKIDIQSSAGYSGWRIIDRGGNVGLYSGVDAYVPDFAEITSYRRVQLSQKGTYTPVVEGDTATPGVGTYTTRSGIYERIGDMVFFSVRAAWTAHTGSGTFKVSLPPIAPDTTAVNQPITLVYSGPSYAADQQMTGYVRPALNTTVGSGCVQILRMKPDGTLNAAALNTSATYDIYISGAYRAA